MNYVGRRIYYDKATGNIIVDTGEKQGFVIETTIDEDFASYKNLSERVPNTVGIIQLVYGQYAQDFRECNSYRVNPETLILEFSYPDSNEQQEIIHQKPLSEQVAELEGAVMELTMVLATLTGGAN